MSPVIQGSAEYARSARSSSIDLGIKPNKLEATAVDSQERSELPVCINGVRLRLLARIELGRGFPLAQSAPPYKVRRAAFSCGHFAFFLYTIDDISNGPDGACNCGTHNPVYGDELGMLFIATRALHLITERVVTSYLDRLHLG